MPTWATWMSYEYWNKLREAERLKNCLLVDNEINRNPVFRYRFFELRNTKFSKRKQAKILRDVFGFNFVREYSI